jgi:5'-3' exonuclease
VGAARDLALGSRPWELRGYDPPWVEFCLKMTQVLRSAGATPVLVFDGCRLPAKAGTNQQRRARRTEARERAQKMLQEVRRLPAAEFDPQALQYYSWHCITECSAAYLCNVPPVVDARVRLLYSCSVPLKHTFLSSLSILLAMFGCVVLQGRAAEADKVFMQCIDVTADMAQELMVRLRWAGSHAG